MSTEKKNITAIRINLLYKAGLTVFHTGDAANLWGIKNKNLLYTTLKRYVKTGLLYRIHNGLYSLEKPEKLDPVLTGYKALHDYCYLSNESILFSSGYISRKTGIFTFIGRKSKKFKIMNNLYVCRQISDKFLYNSEGIVNINNIPTASPERAIADMLYFNPVFNFDREPDWKKIKTIQKKIGYPLTKNRYAAA